MNAAVEVFCRTGCGKCGAVRRWLSTLGHSVLMHDVTRDAGAAARLAELGFTSLPVLLTPDGRAAAGSDPHILPEQLPMLKSARTNTEPGEPR
ncbi:glutaredoxin family protein [Pseudarthrobacter sp. J1738]|uniref:glutaredoxin family protein n=1 Tax=unclassified Pseudarthrobacter TaxID=2647000 RepID=UPI003D2CDEB7